MDIMNRRLKEVAATLGKGVKLIAVSKTKPVSDIEVVYNAGQRIFGENKAIEMRDKHQILPKDIQWHFIGHLQSNKVKYIAGYVSLIHSVDSVKLLSEINRQAEKCQRVIDCLLQFHVADEESKFGLSYEEAALLLSSSDYLQMKNIRIVGVMGMATHTGNELQIRDEFKKIKEIFNQLKSAYFGQDDNFKEISMGMSNDYRLAMEEGSTLVRVGSAIFGERNYAIS